MSISDETLVEAALRVLNTPDPVEKAKLGDQIANNWLQGLISNSYSPSQPDIIVPDRPARLTNVSFSHCSDITPICLLAHQVFDEMLSWVSVYAICQYVMFVSYLLFR